MKVSKKAKMLIAVLLILNIGFGVYRFMYAPVPALSVDEVAMDPGAYEGTITIAGLTTNLYKDDNTLFGIKDMAELNCNNPYCKRPVLPIRFQGPLPILGDEVRVTGTFAKNGSNYYFNSEKLKVVQNHKLGG